MTWLLSMLEVAEQIGKTPATTRVWLHRHCVKAAQRVPVGDRGTPRALYDGDLVKRHAAHEVPTCPACVNARRGRGHDTPGTRAARS